MANKVNNTHCSECQSRMCSIFSDLQADELDILSKYKCGSIFKKGQNVFFEGAPPVGLFCIKSGKVKIHKIDAYGKDQVVRLAKDGDVIGYRSLIANESYSAYATTLEDSAICFIPKDVFFQLLENNYSMSYKLMQLFANKLKSAESFLTSISQKPVRERMAEVLLIIKKFYGIEDDGETLNVVLKREDIANMAGTATETVIRFLAEFKNEGMIDLDKRRIKILDHSALVRTAELND